jgi:hypothetical protein
MRIEPGDTFQIVTIVILNCGQSEFKNRQRFALPTFEATVCRPLV